MLGTSSSESVLPALMGKLETLGASKPVVGLVIPAGYSFNLDGTSIYLTMAAVFIAQATNTPLPLGEELELLASCCSRPRARPASPAAASSCSRRRSARSARSRSVGVALILGIDRFMSEARALTNRAATASRRWWSRAGAASSIASSSPPSSATPVPRSGSRLRSSRNRDSRRPGSDSARARGASRCRSSDTWSTNRAPRRQPAPRPRRRQRQRRTPRRRSPLEEADGARPRSARASRRPRTRRAARSREGSAP